MSNTNWSPPDFKDKVPKLGGYGSGDLKGIEEGKRYDQNTMYEILNK